MKAILLSYSTSSALRTVREKQWPGKKEITDGRRSKLLVRIFVPEDSTDCISVYSGDLWSARQSKWLQL